MSPHFPSSLEEVPARNDGWDAQLLAPCPSIVGRVYVWRESWGKAARGDRNSLARWGASRLWARVYRLEFAGVGGECGDGEQGRRQGVGAGRVRSSRRSSVRN